MQRSHLLFLLLLTFSWADSSLARLTAAGVDPKLSQVRHQQQQTQAKKEEEQQQQPLSQSPWLKKNTTSMCERIHPEDLPEECSCDEKPPLGLIVQCLKVFNSTYFNDTIGMTIDIDPCNPDGSSVSVYVTELDHHINYVIASVRAGEEKDFPIPGLSIIVPGIGHVGVDVAILIAGNPDMLILKVGLNACAVLPHRTICASSIPGLNNIFPWWVLAGSYHFGDICENNTTIATATATTPSVSVVDDAAAATATASSEQ